MTRAVKASECAFRNKKQPKRKRPALQLCHLQGHRRPPNCPTKSFVNSPMKALAQFHPDRDDIHDHQEEEVLDCVVHDKGARNLPAVVPCYEFLLLMLNYNWSRVRDLMIVCLMAMTGGGDIN